jgi:hypothetical protein
VCHPCATQRALVCCRVSAVTVRGQPYVCLAAVGGTELLRPLEAQLLRCHPSDVCTVGVVGLTGGGKSTAIGRMVGHTVCAPVGSTLAGPVLEDTYRGCLRAPDPSEEEFVRAAFKGRAGPAFDRSLLWDAACVAGTTNYLPPRWGCACDCRCRLYLPSSAVYTCRPPPPPCRAVIVTSVPCGLVAPGTEEAAGNRVLRCPAHTGTRRCHT